MLIFTGDKGREIIEELYPPIEAPFTSKSAETSQAPCIQTLLHRGKPQIVQQVNISVLLQLASEAGCTIEIVAAIGDTVLNSTPILRVLGGSAPLPEKSLRNAIEFGEERTFEQDSKYAIRLLVDIAIRALSPGVNDPTTAVQALDQIEDLLVRLGRRRLEIGAYRDDKDNLGLLIAFPGWDDFLLLAFDEICFYGASSVQVMRRMKALVSDLIRVLPEERKPALVEWQERLRSTVECSFMNTRDKMDASIEDRQGLGSSRRKQVEGSVGSEQGGKY